MRFLTGEFHSWRVEKAESARNPKSGNPTFEIPLTLCALLLLPVRNP